MAATVYALALLDAANVTIDAGAIEVSQTYMTVAAESSTTDNLDTITFATALASLLTNAAGVHRPFVILRAAAGHTITIRHAEDNIEFNGETDFVLSGNKEIMLFWNGLSSVVTDLGAGGSGGGSGDVVGPASSTDHAIARFDLTTGKLLQNSAALVSDAGHLYTPILMDVNGNEVIELTGITSAVNQLEVVNSATGNAVQLKVKGGDTNIDLNLVAKGSGRIEIDAGVTIDGSTDQVQLRVQGNGTQSNALQTWENSAGVEQARINFNGGLTVNEQGANDDSRIEGDTDQHLFFVDASLDALGFGAPTIDASAKVQIDSTTKGFLPPRHTTAQRTSIGTPADGLLVYDTDIDAYFLRANGAWVQISTGSVAKGHRSGASVAVEDVSTLTVSVGSYELDGAIVNLTALTRLALGTGANWIGGSSLESASEPVAVYGSSTAPLLYDALPNNSVAGALPFEARVNQVGWVGTAGNGLNATSIVYDTDTGEGNLKAGMLLGIYTDSGYETGRGRGSGAAGSKLFASFAYITAVSTGGAGGTITVLAGHNIAIQDNDYLIAIEYGALLYRRISSTNYRFLDYVENNASSALNANRRAKRAMYSVDEGSNYTSTSTTFAAIDATNLTLTILIGDGDIHGSFMGTALNTSNYINFEITLDGLAAVNDGATSVNVAGGGAALPFGLQHQYEVLPGTHTLQLQWKTPTGTANLYAGAGTTSLDVHSQMIVKEVKLQ
jgi:hypothetical protein